MFFAARNLNANRVNLIMNDYAAGAPSVLAMLGLAASMAPALGVPRWSIRVIPIVHSLHMSVGRTKPELKASGRSFSPDETMEDITGQVRMSLLLDIPECDDELAVAEALVGKRIAGGTITNERIEVSQVPSDGSAFRKLDRGYAIVVPFDPARRLIATGKSEELRSVAEVLYPTERPKGHGWIIPMSVGHRLLENPATAPRRSGTRDNSIPHVFTEPVLGIAEMVSVRSKLLSGLDEKRFSDLLWAWKSEGEWITAHPAYHPLHKHS